MKSKEQVTEAFLADLQALLCKYGAEVEADDYYQGYPECGEDVRIKVYIGAIFDGSGKCLQEEVEIDLGNSVLPHGYGAQK